MFEDRCDHYRRLATRLREMAERTRFADLRSGYLELAAQFERLAARSEARTLDLSAPDLSMAPNLSMALRVEATPGAGYRGRTES